MYRSYFLLLCTIVLCCANTITAGSDCPGACPRIFDPICAFDGNNAYQYFHNECLMRDDMCHSGKAWTLTTMSLCLDQIDPIIRKECIRACHFIYDPICATNGNTNLVFGNECVLAMENCLANGAWTEARGSDCGL